MSEELELLLADWEAETLSLWQRIHPVLDVWQSLPFENAWLEEPPGAEVRAFVESAELLILQLWQGLHAGHWPQLGQEMREWEYQQRRTPQSLLRKYYRAYEALADWAQKIEPLAWRGSGNWADFVIEGMCRAPHWLNRVAQAPLPPKTPEVLLLAQRYLEQMQELAAFDLYLFAVDCFTLIGQLTQQSYFIPEITWPLPEHSSVSDERPEWKHVLNWADLASDYWQFLQKRVPVKMPEVAIKN